MDKIELGHYLGAIPVLILGIFTFPFFHKKILKRQFLEFVNESYKNSFDKETKLSFCNDHIEIQNSTGESKIQYSSLAKIIEISSHFFIVIKAGAYIVLPKSEIPNMVGIRTTLQSIAKENEISYSSELDWKWI
ncbi:YcxB family protein [Xanthomarina sp. F1114]|uniref:YcxB family protein n=1 Tax=Xanthomarina sp. F1114 TaxID=2996019 RepID=UPI00225E4493|nr:YcxB family protein [Xanthomarina sp. F1114]MCX7549030.1 YcxB family protein [Xanthomarina sp. F1114]